MTNTAFIAASRGRIRDIRSHVRRFSTVHRTYGNACPVLLVLQRQKSIQSRRPLPPAAGVSGRRDWMDLLHRDCVPCVLGGPNTTALVATRRSTKRRLANACSPTLVQLYVVPSTSTKLQPKITSTLPKRREEEDFVQVPPLSKQEEKEEVIQVTPPAELDQIDDILHISPRSEQEPNDEVLDGSE